MKGQNVPDPAADYKSHLPSSNPLHSGRGVVMMIAGLLYGGALLPFRFESSSLFYKFGADKAMLKAGKVFGLLAGMLLLLQLCWSARIRFLDRIFGLNNLPGFHRLAGIVLAGCVLAGCALAGCALAGCALAHPRLVYLPDNNLYFGAMENPMNQGEQVAGIEVAFSLNRLDYTVGTGKFLEVGLIADDVDVLVPLEVLREM